MILLRWVVAFASMFFFIESINAQSYPSKPVRLIISFTAGSSTDIVARIVMQKVSEYWGQPAVIENRAGAGGSIGSNVVATAAPDGYTLLVNSSAHAVNPAIFARLPYDTLKDFIDVVIGPDGTPWAPFVDGCPDPCTEQSGDGNVEAVIGRLWGGPSLRG